MKFIIEIENKQLEKELLSWCIDHDVDFSKLKSLPAQTPAQTQKRIKYKDSTIELVVSKDNKRVLKFSTYTGKSVFYYFKFLFKETLNVEYNKELGGFEFPSQKGAKDAAGTYTVSAAEKEQALKRAWNK